MQLRGKFSKNEIAGSRRRVRYLIVLLLAMTLTASVGAIPASAAEGLGNFKDVQFYHVAQFRDVPHLEWYAEPIETAYRLGLINGKSYTSFEPQSSLTIAEALKLAACLHSVYYTGSSGSLKNGDPWYQPYLDYCLENGVITGTYPDYSARINRAQFATIFSKALPATALSALNNISDGDIPDVRLSDAYGAAVYTLYRAGVVTGSDAFGAYRPTDSITRAEVATLVARMAKSQLRRSFSLSPVPGPARIDEMFMTPEGYYGFTLAAERSNKIYYRFGSAATKSDDSAAPGESIRLPSSGSAIIHMLPVGREDGTGNSINVNSMRTALRRVVEAEENNLEQAQELAEAVAAIGLHIQSGAIADTQSPSRAEALNLARKLSEGAGVLSKADGTAYDELASKAKLLGELAELISRHNPSYARGMGMAMWNASAGAFRADLKSLQDSTYDRMRVGSATSGAR